MAYNIKNLNFYILVILFIVLVHNINKAIDADAESAKIVKSTACHKDPNEYVPHASKKDILLVESIISKYWEKRKHNKSKARRILNMVRVGIFKGAIVGVVVGSSTPNIIANSLVFGLINGLVMPGYLDLGQSKFIDDYKHT